MDGPSPRVRGTGQQLGLDLPPLPRSIPACAGNRRSGQSRCPPVLGPSPRVRGTAIDSGGHGLPPSVHPRVCGEQSGSPRWPAPEMRSIPACAGNRRPLRIGICRIAGPSPRVRGTVRVAAVDGGQISVHPRVCGEQLPTLTDVAGRVTVHPRVCGEQEEPVCRAPGLNGPSPRVRGTVKTSRNSRTPLPGPSPRVRGTVLPQDTLRVHTVRSIPACAGNRASSATKACPVTGPSPRVRGTAELRLRLLEPEFGPSPRVRGTGPVIGRLPPPGSVHPRVCGEQVWWSWAWWAWWAVHPRVCGEQCVEGLTQALIWRSIPACAGNRVQ